MRRLNDDGERGAMAVMVALLLVPMLGMGALVIDVGALVQERRELQNGADAAAFAVAHDCAVGPNCGPYALTADEYVDLNAEDGASNVVEVCGSGRPDLFPCDPPADATHYVRVTGSTETSTGGNQITFTLAQVLGFDGATVQMSATAAWGAPGAATTIPLTISECEYDQMTDPDNDNVHEFAEGPPFSATPYKVDFHDPASGRGSCPYTGPAGQDEAGGFGWLDSNVACEAETAADGSYSAKTGPPVPNQCTEELTKWLNTTVLIAVHDEVVNPGTNASYNIIGYAAFHIVDYKFPSYPSRPGVNCGGGGGGSGGGVACMFGYFVNYVTSADEFGGPDMGAVAVKLIG